MNHYLLTLVSPSWHVHGYLMSKTDKTQGALNRMLDTANELDELGDTKFIGALVTPLTTGVDLVREIATSRFPDIKKVLGVAKDFHFSVWAMPNDDPDDRRLMALH
jgi:hypothetical protein